MNSAGSSSFVSRVVSDSSGHLLNKIDSFLILCNLREIFRPTAPPRPLSRETGWPTDRPSLSSAAHTARPDSGDATDRLAPPPSGWVGTPDRPTLLPRAVLLR